MLQLFVTYNLYEEMEGCSPPSSRNKSNMSARVRSRSRGRGDGYEPSKAALPLAQQERDERSEEESPAEILDVENNEEDEEPPRVQEAEMEDAGQEEAAVDGGDGPNVKEKVVSDPVFGRKPEAGDR
ncbi:P antigen family member 4 [Erinaceus europaeus]|uniref:P antigen family member 4 n=1 Tax=Erinaceus europaeus TaxID=9365 RepID=A0A1S2ZRT4_ERIEU|nr:P antigen family member 4 [Erinaceus europaeus]